MLCGYPPFNGKNDFAITQAVATANLEFPIEDWFEVSEDAKNLIERMLNKKLSWRLTAKEALNHQWV